MATTHTLNPHDAVSMASRRAPLATMPNAVNSPFRTTQSVAGKRTRAQLGENVYGQPPAKKQLLDANGEGGENIDPLKRTATVISNEKLDEPFLSKRTSTAPPTAFERKLASVREKKPAQQPLQPQQLQRADRSQALKGDNLENVRQWQRHYRRQFPQFVFYFDSVPDDVRQKAIRQVRSLGAVSDHLSSLSLCTN
jgi:regulatory subunit for Cdc7p protein kinase